METVSSVVGIAIVVILLLLAETVVRTSNNLSWKRSRRRKFRARHAMRPVRAIRRVRPKGTISGKAWVTDGDGLRVSGHEVRIAGIDSPEWDQLARHGDGNWFGHGRQVKGELIRKIGGKRVRVAVQEYDQYGRIIGTVTHRGHDIGEWLVSEGFAIAAYGDQYRHVEREAKAARRGMWGHAKVYDPRAWRHRKKAQG